MALIATLWSCAGQEHPVTTMVPASSETGDSSPASYHTSVAPLATEDLEGSCTYDLLLSDPAAPVLGTWVIFERADSIDLWQDSELRAAAAALRLALLYAHQCNAATYADIQSDGRKGPGRALTAAFAQLAVLSDHPELTTSNLALFGFSAAGVLSITTAELMPARVSTVVTYAAGSAPLELRQLQPSAALEGIPLLMLANADDAAAGTFMSRQYFEEGRSAGAPWAFAVQPDMSHCCTASAAPILLAWMQSIIPLRQASGPPIPLDLARGLTGSFTCTLDGIVDGNGYTDCLFSAAVVTGAAVDAAPVGTATVDAAAVGEAGTSAAEWTAWIPDAAFGTAWSEWVNVQS